MDEPFGAPAGKISDLSGAELKNEFATIPTRNIDDMLQSSRIQPRQLGSGVLRGVQKLGLGGIELDSEQSRISVGANDATVVLGDVSANDDSTGLGVYDGSSVLRLLGGTFPDGSVKIKLSQPGKDVTTATDDELIWSSDFNSFKIIQSDIGQVTIGPGDSYSVKTTSIVHGLSTTPIVIAFVDGITGFGAPGGRVMVPYPQYESYTTGGIPAARFDVIAHYSASADSTNIYLNILVQDVTFFTQLQKTYNFRYYILQETSAAS